MPRVLPVLRPALRSAVCAALLASPLAAQEEAEAAAPARLVVTGEGRASAAPDMALLRLGAQAEAESAAEALDGASEAAQAILDALREAGVAEADIQTAELSLSPRYEPREGAQDAVTGYVASNVVSVRVRESEALGGVLDAAAEAGANRIDGLSFQIEDRGPVLEEARERAVADARRAAETLAEAAGLALGPVLRIEEGGDAGGPAPYADFARAEIASVPIAQGEVETVARVRMVFALEAGEGDGEGASGAAD